MSKDFAPYLLGNFRQPPSLADALRKASSGNCEHPTALKDPKNPTLTGATGTSLKVPNQGKAGGSNLTLAFDVYDKEIQKFEDDRMRWLEHQLSPSRENGGLGTGGGVTLEMESANANLTITPTGPQEQTGPLKWTFTVSTATFVPRWG